MSRSPRLPRALSRRRCPARLRTIRWILTRPKNHPLRSPKPLLLRRQSLGPDLTTLPGVSCRHRLRLSLVRTMRWILTRPKNLPPLRPLVLLRLPRLRLPPPSFHPRRPHRHLLSTIRRWRLSQRRNLPRPHPFHPYHRARVRSSRRLRRSRRPLMTPRWKPMRQRNPRRPRPRLLFRLRWRLSLALFRHHLPSCNPPKTIRWRRTLRKLRPR